MLYKKLLAVCFAVTLAAVNVFAAKAPDFTLKDIGGNTVKLSDYKGKVVFLDFWASWCPPCRNSIPAIIALHKEFESNKDVVILGINVGERLDTVQEFMQKENMTYTILLGDNAVSRNYRVNGIPAFFIIDKEGNIVKNYSGYRSGIESDWSKQINALLK